MGWVISEALMRDYANSHCSPDQVEESSVDCCSGGEPSAPSKSTPTPQAFLSPDKMTAFSRLSRFGITFAPLRDDLGAALLTWYRAAFPARISRRPDAGLESTGSAAGCGARWRELSVRYDRDTSSWKTHQCLWDEGLPESSVTLPKWGSIRSGVLSERITSALPTCESESGFWPTPVAHDDGKTPEAHMRMKARMKGGPRQKPTSLTVMVKGVEQGMYPTPTATNTKAVHMRGADKGKARKARSYVATPTARDWKSGKASPATLERNSRPLSEQIGGQLNPDWVEWLMNWPLGWTSLEPMKHENWKHWNESSAAQIQDAGEVRALWWDRDPSETPQVHCPRVASNVAARVDRLKAIGNGQVPAVVRFAWRLLAQST